jgi:OCT family organic cation transporter-like MFS transporter 4/5
MHVLSFKYLYFRACPSWTFDHSVFPNTVIQEFNLVCDRAYWKEIAQVTYFFGLLVGVLGAGWLSDKYGRKATLGPIAIACGVIGAISAAMPTVESFVALRFLQGLTAIGVFTNAFVWSMEVVGGKWQTIIGIGCEAPWVVSWFLLALVAYILPNWRHMLLACMIPAIGLAFLCFLIPESPKWLLVNGKMKQAEKLVRDAMKV